MCRFLCGSVVRLFRYGRNLYREILLQAQQIGWLAFLNTVRTERFNDVMCLVTRIPAIEAA